MRERDTKEATMTKTTRVDEGTLHLEGKKIWVVWDNQRRETWNIPSVEEAARCYGDMAERWAA